MNNRKCPNCQLVNWADAAQCERCGYPLTAENANASAYAAGDLAVQDVATAPESMPAAVPPDVSPVYAPPVYESSASPGANQGAPPLRMFASDFPSIWMCPSGKSKSSEPQ